MINSSAFNYINVLTKGADASWARNTVLANNIANVDTPNYKRQDVRFESFLAAEIHKDSVLDNSVENIQLNAITPTIYTDQSELSYRLDGNNVDIDVEQTNYAENQIRYNTIVDSISQEFSRLNSVLNNL